MNNAKYVAISTDNISAEINPIRFLFGLIVEIPIMMPIHNDNKAEINGIFSESTIDGSKIWDRRFVRKIPVNIMKMDRNFLMRLNLFFLTNQTSPIVTRKTVINITREFPTDPTIEFPNGSYAGTITLPER
tara:strand:- start:12713 stop:13105 length:393 start_codon:yes stop_codon:yes gene_type:complete